MHQQNDSFLKLGISVATWKREALDLKRLITGVWMKTRWCLCSKGKYRADSVFVFVCVRERWHTSVSPYNEGIVYPRALIGSLDHSIDYSCYLKPLRRRNGWGLIEPEFPLQRPPDNLTFQLSIIWSFLPVVGVILKSCYARRAALINDEIMPTAMTTVLLRRGVLEHTAFARSWHALLDDTRICCFDSRYITVVSAHGS